MSKSILPDLRGVKLHPGSRYMINPRQANKHGAPVYPYDENQMSKCKDLVEYKFEYNVSEDAPEGTAPEVILGGTEDDIVIEQVTVDIPKSTLKPWELAQLARQKKRAEKETVAA